MKSLKLFLFVFIVSLAKAQNDGMYGGGGHFSIGTAFFDFSGINSYLPTQGLPGFQQNCLTMGGGGFGVINNFVIGGEGGFVSASPVVSAAGSAELSEGYGMLNLGYVLAGRSQFLIYPVTGLGWGGSDLQVKYKIGYTEQYTASKFFMNFEINADYFIFRNKADGSKAGFKSGIAFGYQFNPTTDPWMDKNGNYTNIPNTFMNGFYFKVRIGGGGFGFKTEKKKTEN